jgi:hypothetical protein
MPAEVTAMYTLRGSAVRKRASSPANAPGMPPHTLPSHSLPTPRTAGRPCASGCCPRPRSLASSRLHCLAWLPARLLLQPCRTWSSYCTFDTLLCMVSYIRYAEVSQLQQHPPCSAERGRAQRRAFLLSQPNLPGRIFLLLHRSFILSLWPSSVTVNGAPAQCLLSPLSSRWRSRASTSKRFTGLQ